MPLSPLSADSNYSLRRAQVPIKWFPASQRTLPGACASVTTSVTSKEKDHEIAEEHTDPLGIILTIESQVPRDSSGIKRVDFRSKLKEALKNRRESQPQGHRYAG